MKKTKIQKLLDHLREHGPISMRQADELGYSALRSPATSKRLLEARAIEKFEGPNPYSHEAWARATTTLYGIGTAEYVGRRQVAPKLSPIAKSIARLEELGYTVVPPHGDTQ